MSHIAVVGHSLVHIRQQWFFRELARLGHEVTLFCPERWGQLTARPYHIDWGKGMLAVKPLPIWEPFGTAPGEYQKHFLLKGLIEELQELDPAWIYVQEEPEAALARQIAAMSIRAKKAAFTWENILAKPTDPLTVAAYDLVVCGNDDAEKRMKRAGAKHAVILPQVGLDIEHFQARPGVARDIPVAYIGRSAPEKGLPQLLEAYPLAKILEWVDYRQLPWHYSQVQILVCFSQDTRNWREQAFPYVSAEAMAAGCAVIVSDAGSIPFWHNTFPGPDDPSPAVTVPQGSVEILGQAIRSLLAKPELREELAAKGRPWVERHLSSPVIAHRLVAVLQGIP